MIYNHIIIVIKIRPFTLGIKVVNYIILVSQRVYLNFHLSVCPTVSQSRSVTQAGCQTNKNNNNYMVDTLNW